MGEVPAPARVVGNRWIDIELDQASEPTRSLTIVMPAYRNVDALERTLAGIAAQTYPRSLLQVIVADDGSEPPIAFSPETVERLAGIDARVVRQERRGYGRARARNTGAQAADGEIVVFLDSDMIPEPSFAESHARWHHAVGDAVTLGSRLHVVCDDLDAEAIARALTDGSLEALFAGRQQESPGWIEAVLRRTNQLTSSDDDIFRVVTSGNVGMRADLFRELGGFDESFQQYGGEDTELGYRAFIAGAILVPERRAFAWHQGLNEPDPAGEKAKAGRVTRAKTGHHIAHRGFRRMMPGRSYLVPTVACVVEPGDEPASRIVGAVEALLANRMHDLTVCVALDPNDARTSGLRARWRGEPRVSVGAPPPRWSPYVLRLPAGIIMSPSSIGWLVDRMWSTKLGAVAVRFGDKTATIESARARARAERLADGDVTHALHEWSGIETVDGEPLGLAARADGSPAKRDDGAERRAARAAERLAVALDRIARVEPVIEELTRPRAVRAALAMSKMRRARSLRQLASGARDLARAVTRDEASR